MTNYTAPGPLQLSSGTLDVGASSDTMTSLFQSGGTLTGTGELTVTGAATFTANTSTESGAGTTLMEGGASIAASNSLSLTVSRTLELQGMSTVTGTTGGGTIALGTAGTLKMTAARLSTKRAVVPSPPT